MYDWETARWSPVPPPPSAEERLYARLDEALAEVVRLRGENSLLRARQRDDKARAWDEGYAQGRHDEWGEVEYTPSPYRDRE